MQLYQPYVDMEIDWFSSIDLSFLNLLSINSYIKDVSASRSFLFNASSDSDVAILHALFDNIVGKIYDHR